MDYACSEKQNPDPLLNNTKSKLKKHKKKHAEREDSSGIVGDLNGEETAEVEQILNKPVKIKKPKEKYAEMEDFSGVSDDLGTGVRDVEVEQIFSDAVKSKKRKKKRKEREDFSGIVGDLETSVRDEVTAEVEQILNNSDPLLNYTKSKLKKHKKKHAEREDSSGIVGDLNGEETAEVEQILSKSSKIKKRKEKHTEREDFTGISDDLGTGVRDVEEERILSYLVKAKERKEKYKERKDFSGIVGDLETSVRDGEVTAEVEQILNKSSKIKKRKEKHTEREDFTGISDDLGTGVRDVEEERILSYLVKAKERKEKYKERKDFSGIVGDLETGVRGDEVTVKEKQDVNNSGKVKQKNKYTEREDFSGIDVDVRTSVSDGAVTAKEVQDLYDSGKVKKRKKKLIERGDISGIDGDLETRLRNGEMNAKVEENVDSVVFEKVKKTKGKKLLKKKKDSVEVEHNVESDRLISSKEITEDEINSTIHLQDGLSNLDETLTEENANNLSPIIENDTSLPLRQEPVHVFDEEDKDRDECRSVRRNNKRKFSDRISSGGEEKSKANHPLEDGNSFCELENETSPSDINPSLNCQTTKQTPSVKESKTKKIKCYYACDECNRVYTRKDNLAVHKKVKHECVPMFKCSDCGKSYQYKHVLRDHILSIHGDPVTFDCVICIYKAKKEQDLERHVVAMHEGMVYPCSICGDQLKCESNLRRHMKIVHFKQTDFVCAFCGKFFSQAFNLKQHMKYMHSEKTLTCMICECEFENKHKLSMHLLGHAPKVGFNCPFCDYVLVSESDNRMNRHIKEKHSQHMKNAEETCLICERKFENGQKLKRHLFGHAPKVGFNCPLCDYVLVSKSDNRMNRHIKEKHSDV